MSGDPVILTVDVLRAYLERLPQILAAAALFDVLCWVGLLLWWRKRHADTPKG